MAVCIGVDGGGTKTAAVICRVNDEIGHTGTFVGRGFAGPSNKNSVGAEPAVAALWQAVADALEEAQLGAIGDAAVACIVLSMAGCDTEEDGAFWRQACSAMYPSARVVVENDSVAALCSGTDGIPCGIVVISGTGSIGLGIASPQAQRHRVGGMGPMLGDGGNGYSIGLAALGAAVRSTDGRGAATPLRQMILDKYSLRDVDGLLGLAYGPSAQFNNWDEVASLAPLVFRAHEERSCPVASAILQQAAAEICVIAETVAARVQMGRNDEVQVPVVLAGRCAFCRPPSHFLPPHFGLFPLQFRAPRNFGWNQAMRADANLVLWAGGIISSPDSYVSTLVTQRLAQTLPKGRLCRPSMTPGEAAARLAVRLTAS